MLNTISSLLVCTASAKAGHYCSGMMAGQLVLLVDIIQFAVATCPSTKARSQLPLCRVVRGFADGIHRPSSIMHPVPLPGVVMPGKGGVGASPPGSGNVTSSAKEIM